MCRAYSATDLRRLFSSAKGPNGVTKSRAGAPSPSLAHRAASGLERLIARIMRTPAHGGNSTNGRRRSMDRSSSGGASPEGALACASPQYLSDLESR